MNYLFLTLATGMVAIALALLLVPLLRRGRQSGERGPAFATALLVALALPLAAGATYLAIGTPRALDGVSLAPQQPLTMDEALAQLRAHLAEKPDDVTGWMLLGQTLGTLHQNAEARDAFDHVLELDANSVEAMVGWAEADAATHEDHAIAGRARELLLRAVKLQPDSQRGLWLLGVSDFQQGDYAGAAATWRILAPQLEPGSGVARTIAGQIAAAEARAGQAPAGTSGPGLEVEVSLAPALKAKLAPDATLYVYARAENGPPMPLAVARLDAARLPVTVRLDDAMAMTPETRLSSQARVFVGARISRSGAPQAQPGDLEGDAGVVATAAGTPVKIVIDKEH